MSTELALLNEKIEQLRSMVYSEKTNRLNDSLFSKELAPHYMQLAGQLSKAMVVPKAYQGKPNDLFVAMALGYQIGLSVEQSIQAIAVINGRPCLWGDDMLALCMAHSEFVDIIEEPKSENGTIIGYICTVKRRNKSDKIKEFTLNMAKKAGLLGKPGPWTQYPERMLQLRARSWALRDSFPDALKGIKAREEIEDYIEAEYKVVDDKVSRTQFLKEDILFGCALTPENQTEMPTESKAEEIKSISDEQINEIQNLIHEKAFSEERISKALEYYEVNSISELTQDLANHFISQLNKL